MCPPEIQFRTTPFNIFLNDFFYTQKKHFSSKYTNDNTLYSISNTIESVKKELSNDFRIIKNRINRIIHENIVVLNAKKFYCMCFGIFSQTESQIRLRNYTPVPSIFALLSSSRKKYWNEFSLITDFWILHALRTAYGIFAIENLLGENMKKDFLQGRQLCSSKECIILSR